LHLNGFSLPVTGGFSTIEHHCKIEFIAMIYFLVGLHGGKQQAQMADIEIRDRSVAGTEVLTKKPPGMIKQSVWKAKIIA
jgi:hypothetical protein